MRLNPRQSDILKQLEQCDLLEVERLASHFGVSAQTIRKDINQLSEQGLARRLHGGVGPAPQHSNLSYTARQNINAAAKRAIAQALCPLIPEGASLFLGIGSTVSLAAKALMQYRQHLQVVTNNLDVAAILCECPSIDVIVTGGQLRDRDVVGESATRALDGYRADFGVFGTGAMGLEQGLMEFDQLDADITRAILRNANQRILLMDDSKWQRRALIRTADLSAIDVLITNSLPDADTRVALEHPTLRVIETECYCEH